MGTAAGVFVLPTPSFMSFSSMYTCRVFHFLELNFLNDVHHYFVQGQMACLKSKAVGVNHLSHAVALTISYLYVSSTFLCISHMCANCLCTTPNQRNHNTKHHALIYVAVWVHRSIWGSIECVQGHGYI